jgi:hypothetical protein
LAQFSLHGNLSTSLGPHEHRTERCAEDFFPVPIVFAILFGVVVS